MTASARVPRAQDHLGCPSSQLHPPESLPSWDFRGLCRLLKVRGRPQQAPPGLEVGCPPPSGPLLGPYAGPSLGWRTVGAQHSTKTLWAGENPHPAPPTQLTDTPRTRGQCCFHLPSNLGSLRRQDLLWRVSSMPGNFPEPGTFISSSPQENPGFYRGGDLER